MDIRYCFATADDIETLVEIRVGDLRMFSGNEADEQTRTNIFSFFKRKMDSHDCCTLFGFLGNDLIATATMYYYDIMPSNENPKGKIGQITNVWVDEKYRRNGIARELIKQLTDKAECDGIGMVCLNSSEYAVGFYEKLGFGHRDNYLVKML